MRPSQSPRAFTLVELLVVIGIIAVLISILLPALGSARRSAAQVKCSAALKEVGNTFRMYAVDSKGFYPPGKLTPDGTVKYNVDGTDFTATNGAYWFNFLSRYVQKGKLGTADVGGGQTGNVRTRSVFWGCPAFEGYTDTDVTDNAAGVNRYQVGYGMNIYPTYAAEYPKSTAAPSGPFGPSGPATPGSIPETEQAVCYQWPLNAAKTKTNSSNGFLKERVWGIRGTERALAADAMTWQVLSNYAATTKLPVQYNDRNIEISTAQTWISMWRHGKLPSVGGTNGAAPLYDPIKGKLGYNILYADGHVAQLNTASEAFKSVRMKFPG